MRKAWRASQESYTHHPSQATRYKITNLFQRLSSENRNHSQFEQSYLGERFPGFNCPSTHRPLQHSVMGPGYCSSWQQILSWCILCCFHRNIGTRVTERECLLSADVCWVYVTCFLILSKSSQLRICLLRDFEFVLFSNVGINKVLWSLENELNLFCIIVKTISLQGTRAECYSWITKSHLWHLFWMHDPQMTALFWRVLKTVEHVL